jgi:tRNA pseudouridine13 synthase
MSGPEAPATMYLTADLPGIGGRIKERPEDFLVEELPLFRPAGEGEHAVLFVQKRDMSTLDLVDVLARHFGVRRGDVGYAGLKDRFAITRQALSIRLPAARLEDFPSLRHDKVLLLWAERHTSKIRPGHLAGNRFSIRIRGVSPAAAITARRILERLRAQGAPNRFGPQRFGLLGVNHLVGRAILAREWALAADLLLGEHPRQPASQAEARAAYARGDVRAALAGFPRGARTERAVLRVLARGGTPEQAIAAIGRTERAFFLSAFQSAVFNAVLERRLDDGTFARLLEGDLAQRHPDGACFAVTVEVLRDPSTLERLERLEISPSGPMWGGDMLRASGEPDRMETDALAALGFTPERLRQGGPRRGGMLGGTRRPLRAPLLDPEVEGGADEHGPFVRCAFDLPAGAFATTVLDEVMKPTGDPTIAPWHATP